MEEYNDTIDSKMQVILDQYKSKNPYSVPANYFADFSQNMESEKLIFLNKAQSRKNEFKVPSNYFDSLSDRIISHVHQEAAHKPRVRYFTFKKAMIGIAACTVLALSIFVIKNAKNSNYVDPQMAVSTLSDDEIETYVYENIANFDDETIDLIRQEGEIFIQDKELSEINESDLNEIINLYQ